MVHVSLVVCVVGCRAQYMRSSTEYHHSQIEDITLYYSCYGISFGSNEFRCCTQFTITKAALFVCFYAEPVGSYGQTARCEWQSSVFAGSVML